MDFLKLEWIRQYSVINEEDKTPSNHFHYVLKLTTPNRLSMISQLIRK